MLTPCRVDQIKREQKYCEEKSYAEQNFDKQVTLYSIKLFEAAQQGRFPSQSQR